MRHNKKEGMGEKNWESSHLNSWPSPNLLGPQFTSLQLFFSPPPPALLQAHGDHAGSLDPAHLPWCCPRLLEPCDRDTGPWTQALSAFDSPARSAGVVLSWENAPTPGKVLQEEKSSLPLLLDSSIEQQKGEAKQPNTS